MVIRLETVEIGECQLATEVHHVLAEEMGEYGGIKTITHSTTEIHVNNVEHEHIAEIEWKLNHRPRKSLGYLTPLEYFKKLYNFGFGSRCTSI